MNMFLKAIFAVCFLVEIIYATPIPAKDKFRRDMLHLTKITNDTCNKLKDEPCGNERIREIKLGFIVEKNYTNLCSSYHDIVCQVNSALKELGNTCKNITSPIIKKTSHFPKEPANCNLSADRTTMKEFCPKLREYLEIFYNKCTNQ